MRLSLHKIRYGLYSLLIGGMLCGCGDESSVSLTVNFANGTGVTQSSNPFQDSNVRDVIFILTSVAPAADVVDPFGNVVIAAGKILDRNGDSLGDASIYPSDCPSTTTLACGFLPSAADFNISGVPLNYRFSLQVLFRSSTGAILYQGSSNGFDNTSFNTTAITLTVDKL